ncbi:g3692 [Coccomyxa elongata]
MLMDFAVVTALLLALLSCQAAALRLSGTSQTDLRHKSRQLLQAGTCINVPYTNLGGNLLVVGAVNLQTSSAACCQSCWSQLKQAANGGGCNAWVWCGQPAGCSNGFGTVYPYQQCTLKFQPSLQAAQPTLNQTSKYGTSDFTSGWIPTWSNAVDQTPSLPGYSRYTGVDYAGFFDYSCPNSIATGNYCQLSGTLQTVGQSCSADPTCRAFVYSPSKNTGWLKGGAGVDLATVQSLNFAAPNPDAVLYIKASSS